MPLNDKMRPVLIVMPEHTAEEHISRPRLDEEIPSRRKRAN
jgi:hypothetical protein